MHMLAKKAFVCQYQKRYPKGTLISFRLTKMLQHTEVYTPTQSHATTSGLYNSSGLE